MCNETVLSLQDDRRPLHVAAEKGQTNIVNKLITQGALMDAKDKVRTCNRYIQFFLCFKTV